MVRPGRSSITDSLPLTNYVPEKTARSIVCKHLNFLTKKKKLIDELIEMKQNKILDMAERELLRSGPCVQNQIKVLKELKRKFTPNSKRDCLNPALSLIAKLLQKLDRKLAVISKAEEYLCLGIPLVGSQEEALSYKSEVVHEMDVLERIFKDISLPQLPLTRPELGRVVTEYEFPPLLLRLSEFRGFLDILKHVMVPLQAEESEGDCTGVPKGDCMSEEGSSEVSSEGISEVSSEVSSEGISEVSSEGISEVSSEESSGESMEESAGNCAAESLEKSSGISVRRCKAIRNLKFRPSMNENETRELINRVESEPPQHKHRYLCITNGFEIFCLDLKQSKDQTFNNAQDVPNIPRIASLDLVEENLPTLAGLFKWRSNAYMIGGGEALEACSRPKKIKGTSCLIHGLSLAADNGTVSHSESNIYKLKKPKLWPMVEEINGQIHVIDCAPSRFACECRGWIPTHEVFDRDTGSWAEEIPTLSTEELYKYKVQSYSVLGDRIYASAPGASLVFDSNNKKWEAYPNHIPPRRPDDLKLWKEVWQILALGPGKCVGRFPCGGGGEASDPLYVVIALQRRSLGGRLAFACLVNSTGKILCVQCLNDFFKSPLGPMEISRATIILADEEGETMCSIAVGDTWDGGCGATFLYINIFGVEMLSDAAPMVRQLRAKGSEAWPIELDFVRVHTKDTHVYRTHPTLDLDPSIYWAGLQACFL